MVAHSFAHTGVTCLRLGSLDLQLQLEAKRALLQPMIARLHGQYIWRGAHQQQESNVLEQHARCKERLNVRLLPFA